MVNSDVDSVSCNTTQIQNEEEKDDLSKSDFSSSGSESTASSSRKSACIFSSSDVKHSDQADTNFIEEKDDFKNITVKSSKPSLFCSVPLNRIRAVLGYNCNKIEGGESSLMKIKQMSRKLLCLYCDRTFVSSNLRQKHVERCHSEKQSRRLSSRKLQSQFTTTACCYCDKLPVEHSLRQLFEHLISDHSEKYFGCISCEERFLNQSLLNDHNSKIHTDSSMQKRQKTSRLIEIQGDIQKNKETKEISENYDKDHEESNQKLTRSVVKEKNLNSQMKPSLRQLRSKKIAIKASKIGLKRSKRLQAAQGKVPVRKKRTRTFETNKLEETTSKSTEKIKNSSVNPYPEFDNYYRVKKITDHSIDNLKISSLTFDDVFDKAFFSRIKCNIQENLMYHLDGKLFKNEESENRISNFEKNPPPQDVPSTSSENFGCDLSLNALTPVTSILAPHFGEDLESQIEYGSKPSKKKLQPRQDPVRHKYVTRRKYQASILEHKENRDLSKLDMWTQLIIKDRQQKVMNDQKSAKEMLEYTNCEEYKLKVQRTELNRILDRRGPFEDLKEEASKKAALDKLNSESTNQISEECFKEVRSLMEDLLNEVIRISSESREDCDSIVKLEEEKSFLDKEDIPEFPDYLKLQRTSSVLNEEDIDKSDKIALICSSQETENYELPTNTVRAKNEMVELSGEWARSRIYVCAACGLKLLNMKLFLEHKSVYHLHSWVQHYEFVGNQSKLYRHLCIPGLGKVGYVEDTVQCKLWRRSEARMCTKCGKICNALAELHRHILECGGDWTWMLARKKCKYRPFGSRKKRRGLVKRIRERINNQKTEQTEKKKYKKRFEGPRQRPSDADTIQRMLANLPPKRSSRKSICMKDGFPRNLNNTQNKKKQVMKCGKIVMKKSTYSSTESKVGKGTATHTNVAVKRSLRSFNRTLTSKILDTNNKLRVKRQLMKNMNRRSTRRSTIKVTTSRDKIVQNENLKESNSSNVKKGSKCGKIKNENTNRVKNMLQDKINLKSFFPVSKRKQTRNNNVFNTNQAGPTDDLNKQTMSEEQKSRSNMKKLIKKSFNFRKKTSSQFEGGKKLKAGSEPIVVIEKLQQSEEKTTNLVPLLTSISNKRKLRSSFRKVIDKVKKLKLDTSSTSFSSEQIKTATAKPLNSFLGQGTKEKEKLPKMLVPLVEEPKENPPSTPAFVQNVMNSNSPTEESLIPENIFNLEHNSENLLQAKSPSEHPVIEFKNNEVKTPLKSVADIRNCKLEINTQQEISVETKALTVNVEPTSSTTTISSTENASKKMSLLNIETGVKSDKSPLLSPMLSPSALSPRTKGRLRKPNRGLNDCIAMLTKKAFEVTTNKVDSYPNEIFVKPHLNESILDNKNVAHKFLRPNECIMKIPVFESESHKNIQNEVLDLSKPKKKLEEKMENTKRDPIDLSTFKISSLWEPSDNKNLFVQNRSILSSAKLDDFWKPLYSAMQNIVPNNICEKAILKIPKIDTSWTSVDDIIQRVVENRCEYNISRNTLEQGKSLLKIPSVGVSNSVDEIIEEVVKGDITHSQITRKIVYNKDTCHSLNNKILSTTRKRKSRKLIKKGNMNNSDIEDANISIFPSKPLENVNNINENRCKASSKESNLQKICASTVADPIGTSNDSRSLSLKEISILLDSTDLSEDQNKVLPVLVEANISVNSHTSDISSGVEEVLTHSNNSEIQDLDAVFTEIKFSNKKDGESIVEVSKTATKMKDSNELENLSRVECESKNDIELMVEKIEMVQNNIDSNIQLEMVQNNIDSNIQLQMIQKISPKENEVINNSSANVGIGLMKPSIQISEYPFAEIDEPVLKVTIDSAETIIKESRNEMDFLNQSISANVLNFNTSENTLQSNSYSTAEDEPIILEEKHVIQDNSRKSALTDSEDELPLVILKAKSKVVPIMPCMSDTIEQTHKLTEDESIDYVTRNFEHISNVGVDVDSNNTEHDGTSTELHGSSPLNKLITGEFPFPTEKVSSLDQIKYKEVNEYLCSIQCKEKPTALTKSRPKVDRRRSPRKSTAADENPETSTNGRKKTISTQSGKSKNSVKTKLSFDIQKEIVDVPCEEKMLMKLSEGIVEDYEPIHSSEEVICEEMLTTSTSSMKGIITVEGKVIATDGPQMTEGNSIKENQYQSSELGTDDNNEGQFNVCSIPILKVTKMNSKSKEKNKQKTTKTKLILKLPKIILKEPTFKFPLSETIFEKTITDNDNELKMDIVNISGLDTKKEKNLIRKNFQEINEHNIDSQELIRTPVKSCIPSKLKTKLKKTGIKYKKNSFPSTENTNKIEDITPILSESDKTSIILPDILKEIPDKISVNHYLPILSETNIIPIELTCDGPVLNEFDNLTHSTLAHSSITSIPKCKSSRRYKLKKVVSKKKKSVKNVVKRISPLVVATERVVDDIVISNSDMNIDIHKSENIGGESAETFKNADSSKITSDQSPRSSQLNKMNKNNMERSNEKPRKLKIKTSEHTSFNSSELPQLFLNMDMPNNNLKYESVIERNHSTVASAGQTQLDSSILTSVLSQESKTSEKIIEADIPYNTTDSNLNVNIHCVKNSKTFNKTTTSISNAYEKRTHNSETEIDFIGNDNFSSITEVTPLEYLSLDHEVDGKQFKNTNIQYQKHEVEGKQSRNISTQHQIEEKEPTNSRPVRSLRSTVKITYKQSNIFALQVENKEIVDLKITEKSKCSSTEYISEASESSENNSLNQKNKFISHTYDDKIVHYTEKDNEKKKHVDSIPKRNNTTLLSDGCITLFSELDKQVMVSSAKSESENDVIEQDKQSLLEVEKLNNKRQKKSNRYKYNDVGHQGKITLPKEVENKCSISINIPDLHSKALLEIHDFEKPGKKCLNPNQTTSVENHQKVDETLEIIKNDTEVISTNITNANKLDFHNTLEVATITVSDRELLQNEILDSNVMKLHKNFGKNNFDQLDLTTEKEPAEEVLAHEEEITQKKSSKIKKSKKGRFIEFDDLSLAELQALDIGNYNFKNESEVSNAIGNSLPHMKQSKTKKQKKRQNVRNDTSKISNEDHLCKLKLSVLKDEEYKNLLGGISTHISNMDEKTMLAKDQLKKKPKKQNKKDVTETQMFVNCEYSSNKIDQNGDIGLITLNNSILSHKILNDIAVSKEEELINYDSSLTSISTHKQTNDIVGKKNIQRKIVPDTMKNGCIQGVSHESNDAFEFEDGLMHIEELNSKLSRDKDTKIQETDMKINHSTSILSNNETIDKPQGQLFDLSPPDSEKFVKVDELPSESTSIDVCPIRRSRTAKAKALENINTLERNFDQSVEFIDTQNAIYFEENEIIPKKKKSSKISERSKELKSTETIDMTDVIAPRRSRMAKAKALENLCNIEKINNVLAEAKKVNVTESLNIDSILKCHGNTELLSSCHSEVKDLNLLGHEDTHYPTFNEANIPLEEMVVQIEEDHIIPNNSHFSRSDGNMNISTKKADCRTEGKVIDLVYSVQLEEQKGSFTTNQTKMINKELSKGSDCITTSDKISIKVNSCSTKIRDEHNDNPELFSKDDISLQIKKKQSILVDEDLAKLLSETKQKENRTTSLEVNGPTRKSRLAKSKALENINDLKNKTDIIDFEADIIGSKNISDKIEKNSRKNKNRKSENSKLSEENISKESSDRAPEELCQTTTKNYKLNQSENSENISFCKDKYNVTILGEGVNEIDCYDISKIDEDDNLYRKEPTIFSTIKNNKTSKSKVFQKEQLYERNALARDEMKYQTNQIDNSEPERFKIEMNTRKNKIIRNTENINDVPLSQEGDYEYEPTVPFEIACMVKNSTTGILNNDQIEKRIKAKHSKISGEQNYKELNRVTQEFFENLKVTENLVDSDEILLNKSPNAKCEIKIPLSENEIFSDKIEIDHSEGLISEKRISGEFQEDRIVSTEAVKKCFEKELEDSENKRSRRACRVNTYNENDLAEAIFKQASADKEKEKSKKKRVDGNIQHCSSFTNTSEKKRSDKIMNSDELFDLLKATTPENIGKQPEHTFADTTNEMQSHFTDDNFDIIFDDILKKSQALFGEKLGSKILNKSNETSDNIQSFRDFTKSKNTIRKSLESYFTEDVKASRLSVINRNETSKSEAPEDLFCGICKKSFKRIDNLIKHRTTLTHISKLSEIEAKQAEDKMRQVEQVSENNSKSNQLLSEAEITKPSELESLYSYPPTPGNDALKIAEIITNSFEKPDTHSDKTFSEMVPTVSEYRRYKSLGERKSFESDQGSSNISENADSTPYETHIPNNAGVILEKQITLLQNIIENTGANYIDDMSISSYQSLENSNIRDSPVSVVSSKVESSRNFIFPRNTSCLSSKRNEVNSFLKPLQVEDISEDSVNLKNSEDVKSRKVLNRDEELFLECCSLLKSGSEVSNFSKKSNRTSVLSNIALKTSDEPDVFESKDLINKVTEESSDYSRIATPLGESFGDTSNSNTVLSNWEPNEEMIDGKQENYFNFKDNIDSSNEESFHSSKFRKLVSKAIESPFKNASKIVKTSKQIPPRVQEEVDPDSFSKMPTKGALKVFEGLKVSISTVELNLEEVLNNSPPIKKADVGIPQDNINDKQFSSPKTPRSARKSKPVKNKQQLDDRFIFKVKKKSTNKESETSRFESTKETSNKIPDVYDFEETQDNTDLFVKPDFKTFRTKGLEDLRNENIFENNFEGHTLSSSSSSTNSIMKKPKTNECITKKKHMIMGRIFKNALKPKADEDIRDIPNIDHNELVENYVLNCTPKVDEFKKPKMTEEEMNYLFDKLLDKPSETSKKHNVQNKLDSKTTGLKKKLRLKCKKRQRSNSDSTDDEFGLSKIVKKRPSRKNAKEENNSINLEQELKECIGVASRKSQRKCTSGKQNVLVEYWSSDESAFEAFLENHLQELSARTDSPEQPSESQIRKDQKIEQSPLERMGTDKIHMNTKEIKIKSKKYTSSKRKSSYVESIASPGVSQPIVLVNRRKRAAAHPLYHWSSSSEDEMQDLIEVKSIRDDNDDEYDEDRPIQHGWIVGDSPKKLVTMLAQAKGKKIETESSVKEQGKKKNSNS